VLHVLSDILDALDRGDFAVLTLLDLAAAFDTVDDATLLRRLKTTYRITGTALVWFTSYLNERKLSVRYRGSSILPKIRLRWAQERSTAIFRGSGTAFPRVPPYFNPSSETASRQHLRSAASHQPRVPPNRRTTYGGRAFAVAGPSTWNSLPKRLRDPSSSFAVFARLLKTFL